MSQPVLVIGGTRGTGLLIVRLLYQRGIPVRVLARDAGRAAASLGSAAEVFPGDITKEETLPRAMEAARDVIFTAGCRSGRPVREAQVKATEYDGVLNTLAAARRSGFAGRFLYMTSSGVTAPSLAARCLNLYKGNTLVWRRRAEDGIRASGLPYTIIRTGILLNRPGERRAIELTQDPLPLSPRYRIARSDVADAFVAALDHPRAERATFEVVWGRGDRREPWSALLDGVRPDA
jgi:uncharacterized protein YbjT (DUF2867 family)